MTANLFDGKAIAAKEQEKVRKKISEYYARTGRHPCLAVILIGEDPASQIYVKHKIEACETVGILSKAYFLKETISQEEVLDLLDALNQNSEIDGILVQVPLPPHINADEIAERIEKDKDVDGFKPYNFGRLAQGRPFLRPCTPAGIMLLLESTGIPLKGLSALVVGISNIVGRPMISELLMVDCTVTASHRETKNLPALIAAAEILIVAIGNPLFIKGEWIKPDSIVVDVGMNRLSNGKIVGDVEFEKARNRAAWITPVPGGVGPMTVAMLLKNTLFAYEQHIG